MKSGIAVFVITMFHFLRQRKQELQGWITVRDRPQL